MADLVEWLTAQLDADEAIARASAADDSGGWFVGDKWNVYQTDREQDELVCWGNVAAHSEHIALHDPASVLRTIAAHRAILARHAPIEDNPEGCDRCSDVCGDYVATWPCPDVLTLAAIYQDRDGFDPSWKVET